MLETWHSTVCGKFVFVYLTYMHAVKLFVASPKLYFQLHRSPSQVIEI